jgi:hypothetical protein
VEDEQDSIYASALALARRNNCIYGVAVVEATSAAAARVTRAADGTWEEFRLGFREGRCI